MPPKQKQAKKGPAYKTATPIKDLIPSSVKQAPRQSRPIKIPQSFAQIKNIDKEALIKEYPILFEQWPTEEALKAVDFGINSETKFQDSSHNDLLQFIKESGQTKGVDPTWKGLHEIWQLQKQNNEQNQSDIEQESEQDEKKEQKEEAQSKGDAKQQEAPEQPEKIQQKKEKQMVVIETFMRQETEEEMEKRKQEQAEKAAQNAKDKKKGKKEQPKEEGPLQVSDVKMEDIRVKPYMGESAAWIGSHLQIIKQRQLKDVYSEQPVWKKIYPQENGVPQITKSGKYWVKLYYMGKPIKIEIDDRIPINQQNKQLLPVSKKKNEKWTLILSKALIKFFTKVSPAKSMVGSGMIIYALTGMITENISLKGYKDWSRILNLMNDNNYTQKNIILSAFSFKANNRNPSNLIRNEEQMSQLLRLQNSTFKSRKKNQCELPLSQKNEENNDQMHQGEQILEKKQYIQNQILAGYSYCIGDYFENTSADSIFNMSFSQERSQAEKQLRKQYSELSKVTLLNKARDQKLEHRRKKKEIKQKLQQEEKKRLEIINKNVNEYHFVKILGDIRIRCEYSHKEILLAKKCVLNGLQRPPNYQIPIDKDTTAKDIKEDAKSGVSASLAKNNKQDNANIEVNPSLQDFSSLQKEREVQNVLPRNDKGVWIKDEDLRETFDEIQIFYNPNAAIFEGNKAIEYIEFKGINEFNYEQNAEILMIEKKGNPHLDEENKEEVEENKGNAKLEQSIKLLFGFSYQHSQWDTLGNPYCMLQKFDFDSYRTTSNVCKLQNIMNSTYLELKNQNTVFKLYTMSKGRYAYWISSNAPYKLLSISKYLEQIEGYSSKNFTIECPPLETGTYIPLAYIKVCQKNSQGNTLILKFQNTPTFKALQKYLTYKLVSVPDSSDQQPYTSQNFEGVVEKCRQSTHFVSEYTRIEIPSIKAPQEGENAKDARNYYLIVDAYPKQNIGDGTLQLQILSKNPTDQQNQIANVQQIQPYKVVEKYTPNKYATIMKERIYLNKSNKVSLFLKVVEGEEGQAIGGGGKAAKKGGKQEQVFEIVEKPLAEQRLIHVKILKNNKLLYYGKGYNEVAISHIFLQDKEQTDNEYYLQAAFDLRDWPEANLPSQETNKIYWVCQIYGEDSIGLVKDTKQQEKQRQTKKSWEDKQPGRAEKAKKARLRYLLECRKQKGQQLTEEELQIINAPRLTKKQLQQQEKKNQDKKGGKGAKKDDKKAGKDKKDEVIQEKKEARPFPKASDNFMTEIKQFVRNLEQCKVNHIALQQEQQQRVRSQQQLKSIKEGAMMSAQNKVGQLARNIEMRESLKIREKDKKDKLTIALEDSRSAFMEQWKKYIDFRTQDKEKDSVRQQKEKALIDIITTSINPEKTLSSSQADVVKLISEYRQIEGCNQILADVGQMIRKNIKINNLVQKINNLLAGWEVDDLKNAKEQISKEKIEGIEEELMKQVNEMLEEAEKNPNLVQEKQAELKKAKKGGKK